MKVLGIVGSPRKNGNTEILTAHALKAIAEEGIDTELIRLAGLDIRPCNHCKSCHGKDMCAIKDDLNPIYERMKQADGFILSCPVYSSSASGLITCFKERTGYISVHNGLTFSRKVGGPLVVARRVGHNFTVAQLALWFIGMDMVMPGSTYWPMAFGWERGDVSDDEEGLQTATYYAKNIAWLVKKLRS